MLRYVIECWRGGGVTKCVTRRRVQNGEKIIYITNSTNNSAAEYAICIQLRLNQGITIVVRNCIFFKLYRHVKTTYMFLCDLFMKQVWGRPMTCIAKSVRSVVFVTSKMAEQASFTIRICLSAELLSWIAQIVDKFQ